MTPCMDVAGGWRLSALLRKGALVIGLFASISGFAAELTRGPYLQSGTPESIVIKWRTDEAVDSRVRYGRSPTNLSELVSSSALVTEHKLKLTGLTPDTRYYYSVRSSEGILTSGPEYFFVTSPTNAKPTRIWALGDSGTASAASRAVRDAYYAFAGQRHTDIWLMLGDNAYQSGTDAEYTAAVFDIYPEMLRKSVLWPTIGNHETYANPVNMAYLSIFALPTAAEAGGVASGTERYYSFDYGNIHFVCLDAMNSNTSTDGPMATWLQQDLAANTNFWLIAFWHHPPYSKGSHDSDDEGELITMRQNFVPILESYGVDLVLCGHSHSYERSFLLNGHYRFSQEIASNPEVILDHNSGRTDESGAYLKSANAETNRGTVYVVAGCSGQISGGTLDHPAMFVSLNQLGSLVLDLDRDQLTVQFLKADGVVGDHFTIQKGAAFRVTAIQVSDGFVSITWNSVPGQNYYVAYSADIESPNWIPVSGGIPASGTKTSWSGFLFSGSRGFYRVVNF